MASDCSQEDRSEKAVRRFDSLIQVLQQVRLNGIEVGPFLSSRAYRHWLETGRIAENGGDRAGCLRSSTTGLDLVRPREADKAPSPAEPAAAEANGKPISPAGRDAATEGAMFVQEHYVFAQIIYPDDTRGLLVYLRPTLTGDEGDSLLHGVADTKFPDDDPLDQFYTPMKMTTYRLLGRHIADELMHDPVMKDVLSRISAGEAATSKPTPTKSGKVRASCDSYCGTCDPCDAVQACVWNHQRAFRPAIVTTGGGKGDEAHPVGHR